MDIISIAILISILINLFFGLFVLIEGRNRKINLSYFILNFCMVLWSFALFSYHISDTQEMFILWTRLAYAASVLLLLSFYVFINVFTNNFKKKQKIILFFLICYAVILIYFIIFTNTMVETVTVKDNLQQNRLIVQGYLFNFLFPPLVLFLLIWSFVMLIKKLKTSTGLYRMQIKYIFIGSLVSCILIMFSNFILYYAGIYNLYWLGPIFTLIMLGFIAYTIIRYKLMDINLAIQKSGIYFFTLISIFLIIYFFYYFFSIYFTLNKYIISFFSILITAFLYPTLRDYFSSLISKLHIASPYNSSQLIDKLSLKLQSTLDAETIYKYLEKNVTKTFHCKNFGILIYDEKKKAYVAKYKKGFENIKQKEFPFNKTLYELFTIQNKPIITDEIKQFPLDKQTKRDVNLMIKGNVDIMLPLIIQNKNIGSIVLGPKESGDIYNSEDIAVLNIIGSQVGISLENANLYKELQKKNKHLRKLLAMRSEFLDIASHQLRTPVSIIRGSLSMMKEQDGLDSLKQKELLENSFKKSLKLKEIINDILDASELDTDKEFAIKKEKVDIRNLIKKIGEEKKEEFKEKGIKFKLNISDKNLPCVYSEERYLKQVIDILINNALQYTLKGEITVSAFPQDGNVCIEISDTGIGIPESDTKSLFKKFERASNATSVYTDGSGLGLFIAKKIIDAHKGAEIFIKNTQLNKGTTFEIRLPIQ